MAALRAENAELKAELQKFRGQLSIYCPNDIAHPGCPEEVDITAVLVGDDDVYEDLSRDGIAGFEVLAIE